ncbi:DUF6701 domain-containing protein [Vibrio rotiferianus]|uniref:DUF6701 domain-containing protein n=1 Tax=Vibrio rotiferianus TaxID=190895 RepID=UPI000B607E4B|nr:DUF6701 domain-containing protein [Vibrio rotiferianus]ASI95351.1 hypothetical protein BSZ04_09935 [Vibrio rotiferianus]
MRKVLFSAIFISLFSFKCISAESYDMTPYWSLTKGEMKSIGNLCNGYYNSDNDYVCRDGLYLSKGQSIMSNRHMNIHVYGDVEFKGKNVIGSSAYSINILSKTSYVKGSNQVQLFGNIESYGSVELKNNIDINGSVYSSHGKIYFEGADVTGNVTSHTDSIEVKGNRNVIDGDIWGARDIVLSKVTVKGDVTSDGGQIKTEKNSNTIDGDVVAHGDVVLKKTVVRGSVTSRGGAVKTENSNNQIYGDIEALHDVVLKGTKVVGNIQSRGEEIKLENAGGGNSVYGNLVALHQIGIKNSLVCGQVTSRGSEVKLENSGENQRLGVYAYTNAIRAYHKATVKNSSVCGEVAGYSTDFHQEKIYCGVNEPNCNRPQTIGNCPLDTLEVVCPDMVPDPEPIQCKPLPPEDFDSGSLTNWSVMGFGDSTDPEIRGNKFRLNANRQRQATASAYNYIFPSDQNYLEIEFEHYAYGGGYSGGDGIALVISDANVPPKTGAFGGPLGYGMKLKEYHGGEVSSDVEGFAGGWLGIGIDEYGNFYQEGGETRPNGTGKPDNVGIRGSGSQDNQGKWLKGYGYVKGKQFSSSIDNHNDLHRYKITLNSRDGQHMMLKVERSVNRGEWNTVISDFDVRTEGHFSQAPTNFRLSVTASTGAATNLHEIDNFKVCADKYSRLTDGIHHFEFDYAGSGSTCQASDVTLRACMNESCTEQYPRDAYDDGSLKPLSVTLLPSADNNVANWVGGTNVKFENETQLELQGSRAGNVTLGIGQSSVPQFGFEGARCRINGGPLSADNCNVTFAQNVLAVNVNDVVASRETTGEDYLSFCSTRTEDGGESRGVNMSVDYEVAPVDSSQPVVISYKKKVKDQTPEWSSTVELTRANKYLPNVYFNSEGKAFFKLKYAEAGKVKLKASVEGVDDSDGFGSFVSFPSKLKVTARSGDKSGECSNSENGCSSGFVAAGEVFELTISALQDDGSVAENYQEKTITVSNKVKYPSNGSLAKLLNEKLPEPSKWSNGSVTFDQSVSEVGAFELIAEAPVAKDENGDDIGRSLYLGSKAFKIADGKLTIGRFYPDYFKVTGTEWTYPDNQNDSVYMGQNFASVKFEVTAYNADGYATQNYGGFADSLKADLHLAGGYSERLSILDSDLTSKNWSGAIWSKTWVNSVDWSKAGNLDGPFNSKVSTDSPTESSISLSLNKTASTKTAHIDPTLFLTERNDGKQSRTVDQQLLSQPDVRYGRMALDDVGGKQGEALSIPLRVEYWNKSRFVISANDNRTTVSAVEQGNDKLIWSSPDGITACDINLQVLDSSDSEILSAKVTNGMLPNSDRKRLTAKQGCKNEVRQQSQVWLDLDDSANGLPWLKYDWDNDGSEENPSTIVTFGINRGNDRVIYRGEPGLTGGN